MKFVIEPKVLKVAAEQAAAVSDAAGPIDSTRYMLVEISPGQMQMTCTNLKVEVCVDVQSAAFGPAANARFLVDARLFSGLMGRLSAGEMEFEFAGNKLSISRGKNLHVLEVLHDTTGFQLMQASPQDAWERVELPNFADTVEQIAYARGSDKIKPEFAALFVYPVPNEKRTVFFATTGAQIAMVECDALVVSRCLNVPAEAAQLAQRLMKGEAPVVMANATMIRWTGDNATITARQMEAKAPNALKLKKRVIDQSVELVVSTQELVETLRRVSVYAGRVAGEQIFTVRLALEAFGLAVEDVHGGRFSELVEIKEVTKGEGQNVSLMISPEKLMAILAVCPEEVTLGFSGGHLPMKVVSSRTALHAFTPVLPPAEDEKKAA